MTTDERLGGVLLFGGNAAPAASGDALFLNDTWLWSVDRWTQLHPALSPPARSLAMLAYNPETGRAVLFGGLGAPAPRTERMLGDTWTWDGATWSEAHPNHTPPARALAGFAFDPLSSKVVMVGGAGNSSLLRDAWAWDGSDWSPLPPSADLPALGSVLTPGPGGTLLAVGSCDSRRPTGVRVQLVGGAFAATAAPQDAAVATRCTHAVAVERPSGALIAFSGTDGFEDGPYTGATDERSQDTLVFDGHNWNHASVTGAPPGRQHSAAAYDPSTKSVIVFGGDGGSAGRLLGDTWAWAPSGWRRVA